MNHLAKPFTTPSIINEFLILTPFNPENKDTSKNLVLAAQEYFPNQSEIGNIYAIFGPSLKGVSGVVDLLALSHKPTHTLKWNQSNVLGSLYQIPDFLREPLPNSLGNSFSTPFKPPSIAKPKLYFDKACRYRPLSLPRLLPSDYLTHPQSQPNHPNQLFFRISGSYSCPILTPFSEAPSTPRRGLITYANDGCFFSALQVQQILQDPSLCTRSLDNKGRKRPYTKTITGAIISA